MPIANLLAFAVPDPSPYIQTLIAALVVVAGARQTIARYLKRAANELGDANEAGRERYERLRDRCRGMLQRVRDERDEAREQARYHRLESAMLRRELDDLRGRRLPPDGADQD